MGLGHWAFIQAGMVMFALGACDGPGGGGQVGGGRVPTVSGGPDGLGGVVWGMSHTEDGLTVEASFQFGTDTLVAANTCTVGTQRMVASIRVPVRYGFADEGDVDAPDSWFEVLEGDAAVVDSGVYDCAIWIEARIFGWYFEGETLVISSGGDALRLTAR